MKRAVLLFLLLALVGLSAGASYRIQLTSGKIITADDKPLVKQDVAFFNKNGVLFYLPASQVDMATSEKLNAVVVDEKLHLDAKTLQPGGASDAKPIYVGEEQLEEIRQRSRLANEGQFQASPAEGEAAARGPEGQAQQASGARGAMQDQLMGLLQRQSGYQAQQSSLQNQLAALKESFNTSPQQNEKERIQQQIDALSQELVNVESELSSTQGEIQHLQSQISSAPVMVEQPGAPTPPQPQPAEPAPEGNEQE